MEWKNLFSNMGDMVIVTPDDLKSAPLSAAHSVTSPRRQSDLARELWNAAHEHGRRSGLHVNIRPFSGACPLLDAFSMGAEPKSDSAEESNMDTRH